jgi:hypothetical protein
MKKITKRTINLKLKTIKTQTATIATLLIIGLVLSAVFSIMPTAKAENTILPSAVISYTYGYGIADVNMPSTSTNITRLSITAVHATQGTTTLDVPMDSLVIALIYPGPPAKSPYYSMANIFTSSAAANPDFAAWNAQNTNGTSIYTEINGNVTIDNRFMVADSELRIQKTGNNLTVDFNPAKPINITLAPSVFPSASFSSSWILPAFHIDFYGDGNQTLTNSTNAPNPSGWITTNNYVYCSANATFSSPSWNNYSVVANSATVRAFNYRCDKNPSASPRPIPTNANYTVDTYTGYGTSTIDIPTVGNITRLAVTASHIDQGTMGTPDIITLTLSSPLAKGTVQARITTNPNPESFTWVHRLVNGTSAYTEINGVVTINNIFQVTANEVKVQRNGTHLTVDFNPEKPIAITLDPAVFPQANFSSTWTVPAFHMNFDGYGSLIITNSTATTVSGWFTTTSYAGYAANSTFVCSAWNNYTTLGTNSAILPYVVSTTKAPAVILSPTPTPAQTPTPTLTPIPVLTPVPTSTPTPPPTATPKASAIVPASTPIPTMTPLPTVSPTAEPTQQPISQPTLTPSSTQQSTIEPSASTIIQQSNSSGTETYIIAAVAATLIVVVTVALIFRKRIK